MQWPLGELLRVCRQVPLARRQRITFEYVLLDGINDSAADARRLVALVQGIECKINLILYNPSPDLKLTPTTEARAASFRRALGPRVTVSLRRSRGRRHDAACGQLAGHMKKKRR